MANSVTKKRKIIVNIATSADGYIARPDGDIEWLTRRPAPKGFYGMGRFMQSIDATLFGRKTYEVGLQLGATFDPKSRRAAHVAVCSALSRRRRPATLQRTENN